VLGPEGVSFRLAIFWVIPCVFLLRGVLVVFSVVSMYMVSEPNSSLTLGRVALGYSYPGCLMGFCLAMVDLRSVLSWVSVCCMRSLVCCGEYRYCGLVVSF